MKFSTILPLAFAVCTIAHGLADPLTTRESDDEDVYLTEEDLDIIEGIVPSPVDKRFVPPVIKPVSTKCAAHPRAGVTRRSTEQELDEIVADYFQPRSSISSMCNAYGHLTHPGGRTFIHNIKFQRCANTCVCRGQYNGCMTFAWMPHTPGSDRGQCILYKKTLDQMGFVAGPGGAGDFPTRHFYSRTCYHKGKPYPTNIQTTATPSATAPPRKRDVDLESNLIAAMERI